MAPWMRGFVTVGAAMTMGALLAACGPDPVAPTPSPTPSVTTPSETDSERQMRLDYEAAEGAYRAAIAEMVRQSNRGQAARTQALTAHATGAYLDFTLSSLAEIKNAGWHTVGRADIVGVSPAGWALDKIRMTACEDGSEIRVLTRSGRDVTPSVGRRFVQHLTVARVGKQWKVSDQRSERVEDFEGQVCAG